MATALVTGGGRGIGRAVATRLAEDGHDIAVGYGRDASAAEEVVGLVEKLGRRSMAVEGDLERIEAPDAIVHAVEQELGSIEILVANAGVSGMPCGIADITVDEWERIIAINLRAPFLLARRVLPAMAERGFGRIVFISSIAAYTGGLVGGHYAASKAGLHGLAHSLAQQGAGQGVTVNVVAPALVDTDMVPDDPQIRQGLASSRPVGRLGRPEEAGDLVSAIVAIGYLTNQSIVLDGGAYAT